jgi:hypothetical protein
MDALEENKISVSIICKCFMSLSVILDVAASGVLKIKKVVKRTNRQKKILDTAITFFFENIKYSS